jgi:Uma2 family endonuclease
MHEQATSIQRHRFSREDYYRMAEANILGTDVRVELLDGEIVQMSPIGPRHCGVVDQLAELLITNLSRRAAVRIQAPVAIDQTSEPEPDISVVERRDDYYKSNHPTPNDILLLVEVAETSVEKDRGQKLHLYAKAGIPEYWIIDIERRVLIVHRDPLDDEYGFVQQHDASSTVAPQAFPGLPLELGPLFSY